MVLDYLVNRRDQVAPGTRRSDIAQDTVALALVLGHPTTMVEDLIAAQRIWIQDNPNFVRDFQGFLDRLRTLAQEPEWPYARLTGPAPTST